MGIFEMINYSIYRVNTGEIIIRGTAQLQEDILPLLDSTTNVIFEQSTNYNYVDNGVIVYMPEKPGVDYIFNYVEKKWIKDIEGMKTKALNKRNALLADGPDRINPMWWSSMTEQEQQAWTFYRQALLDITKQADYPEFIVWPIKP